MQNYRSADEEYFYGPEPIHRAYPIRPEPRYKDAVAMLRLVLGAGGFGPG